MQPAGGRHAVAAEVLGDTIRTVTIDDSLDSLSMFKQQNRARVDYGRRRPDAAASVGLGRIVALYYRSSTSYQIC